MRFLLIALFVTISIFASCNSPEELGNVNWLRDYNEALAESQSQDKPILILFQEVPGCSTCRNYGHNVLSHPLMVEAIEDYFVPLAIYNNKGGDDGKILKKYGEPSWNNPVVRIVDQSGKDLTSRLSSDYSAEGLFAKMEEVLKSNNVKTKPYFDLLGKELNTKNLETATYRMFCFWSGESHLGNVDGVHFTEPGFSDGYEVVKVTYDPRVISYEDLSKKAEAGSCKKMEEGAFRADKDPQYYLKNSKFSYLPLSKTQRTKINSALKTQKDASVYLSPKQVEWYKDVVNGKDRGKMLYHLPLQEAWEFKTKG